jgi:chitinase
MRFSSATTLFSLASIAQAAPALHQRENALQYDTNYGAKYQAGIFYVNWVRRLEVLKALHQTS